jgi:ABC-type phosphate transport system substrate-binding protein
MNRRNLLRSFLAAVLGWPDDSFAATDPISIVVHKRSSVSGVDRNELRQIFQTNKTAWSQTGDRVTPLNLPEKHLARQEFDRVVLGLEPDRVARYWVDRKIRGDARPPRTAPNPAAVVRAVAGNPEMVGYVPTSEVGKDVKVIARIVDGKLQGV